jgi:fatty-acyl-CoA synthase
MNVGDWIGKWSSLQPEKTALFFEDCPLTYGELNRRVNQLCHLLLGMGIRKGDRVSVLLYNCNQYIEIFFGLAKIGAIMVPLNWRLVGPDLEFIVKDSGSQMLIFDAAFGEIIDSIRSNVDICQASYLSVGSPHSAGAANYEEAIQNNPCNEPPVNSSVGGEDPHIIMYTSGTTGIPKGVVLSHRKTFFNVLNANIFNDITSKDIMIVCRPMFHSGGLLVDSAPILYRGGTLIMKRRFQPHDILESVQKHHVTLLELPASVYQFVLQQCDLSKYNLSSVRVYFTGGERVPEAMLREYNRRGIIISQIFGLTEASTITFLSPEDAISKMGSVGLPVFHGEVRIVNKAGNDVRPGEVGRVIIKGPTLMSGFWNRPDLASETIRDGWLHTGDLAKMDEEGYFYIVDRESDMYISGGENVYPAEIEKVILTHPKVSDVGIVGVPDPKWGEVGKAFIVLRQGERMMEKEVFEFLQGKVAKYKIPKYVEFVHELPKTASGKIQKFLLKRNLLSDAAPGQRTGQSETTEEGL